MQGGFEYLEPVSGAYVCGKATSAAAYRGLTAAGVTSGVELGSLASLGWFTGSDGNSGSIEGDPDIANHEIGAACDVAVPGAARFWTYAPARSVYNALVDSSNLTGQRNGGADDFIVQDFLGIRTRFTSQGVPFFIRGPWEFNGSWNSPTNPSVYSTFQRYWSTDALIPLNTNAAFIDVWRRMVVIAGRGTGGQTVAQINARLSALGMPNLLAAAATRINALPGGVMPEVPMAWVWCPNRSRNPATAENSPWLRYPGDEWVDWVGCDMYARMDQNAAGANHNENGTGDGAAAFNQNYWNGDGGVNGFGPAAVYARYCAPGTAEKPFCVPEISTNSPWDYTNGDQWSVAWFNAFFARVRANPKIKLFNLYNNNSSTTGAGDHRIDAHNVDPDGSGPLPPVSRSAPLTAAAIRAEILTNNPAHYLLRGADVRTGTTTPPGPTPTTDGANDPFPAASFTLRQGDGATDPFPTASFTLELAEVVLTAGATDPFPTASFTLTTDPLTDATFARQLRPGVVRIRFAIPAGATLWQVRRKFTPEDGDAVFEDEFDGIPVIPPTRCEVAQGQTIDTVVSGIPEGNWTFRAIYFVEP